MASFGYRPNKIRFGIFELDVADRMLRKRGDVVKLQPQQFDVLLILVENAGRVVSREEIRERIWEADTFVDFQRSINFAVNQIRAQFAYTIPAENEIWLAGGTTRLER
jgi:DNA-binding response OmpR family regulator